MIRLKELREERKWTMRQAASYLNKSYTTYVNHEKGYREPNSEDLTAYAKAYDVSVDYLIGRSDNRAPNTNDHSDMKDALRFALNFGADVEITDEMYEEIRRFAAFTALRDKEKKEK